MTGDEVIASSLASGKIGDAILPMWVDPNLKIPRTSMDAQYFDPSSRLVYNVNNRERDITGRGLDGAPTSIDYDDPGGRQIAETLEFMAMTDEAQSDGMTWDMSPVAHPRVSIAGISQRLKFAVGLDTGCQTPVVRRNSPQDLMLRSRSKCHGRLLGFDDSCLVAHEKGVLEYYLGTHKISRTVLVVDGLHEDYLDSLSDVADIIFYRDGGTVGLDIDDDLQIFKTRSDATLPILDMSVTVAQIADGDGAWADVPATDVFNCQRVVRGMHDERFDANLRKIILTFRKTNGLTVEELVHLKLGHQGWTSALKYELRKMYGPKFNLPNCQCSACTAMAPEAPRRRFRSVKATLPGQVFSYDLFYVNSNLNLLYVVDDYTVHGWVHKVDAKSDVSNILRDFDAKVQTHILARFGKTITLSYRSDNGGENVTFAK